jgi:hypothetical protein
MMLHADHAPYLRHVLTEPLTRHRETSLASEFTSRGVANVQIYLSTFSTADSIEHQHRDRAPDRVSYLSRRCYQAQRTPP